MSEKRRSGAKDQFKKAKLQPLDLRVKKTRAFRKRLTKFESTKKTLKQQKKADNYKLRKFALAA